MYLCINMYIYIYIYVYAYVPQCSAGVPAEVHAAFVTLFGANGFQMYTCVHLCGSPTACVSFSWVSSKKFMAIAHQACRSLISEAMLAELGIPRLGVCTSPFAQSPAEIKANLSYDVPEVPGTSRG